VKYISAPNTELPLPTPCCFSKQTTILQPSII